MQGRQGRLKCGQHNLTVTGGNFRLVALYFPREHGCFPAWPLNVDANISAAASVVYYEERTSGVRPLFTNLFPRPCPGAAPWGSRGKTVTLSRDLADKEEARDTLL